MSVKGKAAYAFLRATDLAIDVIEMPVRLLIEGYKINRAVGRSAFASAFLPTVLGYCCLSTSVWSAAHLDLALSGVVQKAAEPAESSALSFLIDNPTGLAATYAGATWGFAFVQRAMTGTVLLVTRSKKASLPPLLPRFSAGRPK